MSYTNQANVQKIINHFRGAGHKISALEKELGLSNGILGKAAKTVGVLSEKKYEVLEAHFKTLFPLEVLEVGLLNEDEVLEVEAKNGQNPLEVTSNLEVKQPFLEVDAANLEVKPTKTEKATSKLEVKKTAYEDSDCMKAINKKFGAGTVMRFGNGAVVKPEIISTGSIGLDRATGIGGLPMGRMVEIFGPESSGKTTIALHIIANAQKKGHKCMLIDAESSFDPEYAEALGIDIEAIEYCQPSFGEQGFQVLEDSLKNSDVKVYVIDSVAAMIPRGELDGEVGDAKMGLHARLMSQICRKIVGIVGKKKALVLFINQLRNKIGVMYGSPEVTTGGMALQFYASLRLDVRRKEAIKDGEEIFGNRTRIKVVKNKCAPPMKYAEFDIIHGEGVNRVGEIVDLAVEVGVVKKMGSWYSYNEAKLGQGRDNACQLLKDNPEMAEEILSKCTQ